MYLIDSDIYVSCEIYSQTFNYRFIYMIVNVSCETFSVSKTKISYLIGLTMIFICFM